jgi:hypothetical protein
MSIIPRPPKESHRRAKRALECFLELRQNHELLGEIPPEMFNTQFLQSLPVYGLSIRRQGLKSLRREAKRIAWLYFLQYDSHTAALEISIVDGRHRNPRFQEGASISTLLDLVEKARRWRGTKVRDAKIRLLRIPALNLNCMWLHGESDTIIPVNELPPYLDARVKYSPEDFVGCVNDAAKNMLSLHAKYALKRQPRR